MDAETPPSEEPLVPEPAAAGRPLWRRIALWLGIAIGALALLVVAVGVGVNTGPGRGFVTRQIANYTTASGLNFSVGSIEGSLFGRMVLRDVEVRDLRGVFARSPEVAVDWRPFNLLWSHVDIRSLASPYVRVDRMPELKPGDPNAPWLPDIDIDVGRLSVSRIELGPRVTGQRQVGRLDGSAHIADRRAQVLANAAIGRGDRLALNLDAVPDDNRFDLDLKLNAPKGGLVATLAKLEAPLTLEVAGKGDWKAWNGTAVSTLGGGQLANLRITNRSGTFQVRGPTRPGLYLKGPVERLTAPQLDVQLDAKLNDRTADTRLLLKSQALALMSTGLIDLGRNRFGNFHTEAALLTPGAIAPNLNGRSVRAEVALDGPFATPTVDYKIAAASLGFGEMRVEQLYAEGRARTEARRFLVPVRARAGRVLGLNAAAGRLLTNVTVNGDLAITGDQILSDNLRLRSDKIDATAIVAADISSGRYTGALRGRVNDFLIDGVGIVNVTTDAKLYAPASGGFGIRGRVAGTTTRIFNEGARSFLGGNAVASADIDFDPKGVLNFSNLRMRAPRFRITGGSGRYDPAGPLLVNVNAVSSDYGPLFARVSGTVARPEVLLRAPRPGLGVGLADLEARIRGQNQAYAVVAKGNTNYGPFTADVLLRMGAAMTIDVRNAHFAGMDLKGRLQQTRAGPFAGQLAFAGSGVTGNLRLDAEGSNQRADFDAKAYQAQIPGSAGLMIGRALVSGHAVLYPEKPLIVADVQVANLRYGQFVMTAGRVRVNYQGGRGTAQAFARGSSGVPFQVAANAQLTPNQYLVALKGQTGGVNFHTVRPARIVAEDGTYRLSPTQIDFDRGSARLAGTYGNGMNLQVRLDKLDLAAANAFVPGSGVGGAATGAIDFTQGADDAFPHAQARLNITGFTRSSLSTVSTPVDIALTGSLDAGGGEARALIKRGTTPIGRMVAVLRPVGEGASWSERLMAAPLSGGIRYNGPAGVLFSLAGLADQTLSGPIAVAADFSGRANEPHLSGIVRANNLIYENESYGTRLTAMRIDGTFSEDQLVLNQLSATAGDGTLTASGRLGLSAAQSFPMDVKAEMRNARLARSDDLGATATGTLHVTNGPRGGLIEGNLTIPEMRYQIIRQGAAEVPELTGVRRKSDLQNAAYSRPQQAESARAFRLNIRVRADNRLYVSGMGLDSEWEADIRVRGTTAAPRVTGEARIVRGTYTFASKRLDVTRGVISFEGAAITDPSIDIQASTTAEGITAIINITGTGQKPHVEFTSTPALPQDEVLARLLFGSSVTNLSATEAIQLAAALNSLSGSGGLNPLGALRSASGIDRLRILNPDDTNGHGTALAAGKYITDDIYIEIITDARGYTATQLEIALTRALSLLSQTGSFGGSSVSVRYSRDY